MSHEKQNALTVSAAKDIKKEENILDSSIIPSLDQIANLEDIDLKQADEFVKALYHAGIPTIRLMDDNPKRKLQGKTLKGLPSEHEQIIKEFQEQGFGCYVHINELSGGLKDNNVISINSLFVDMDNGDADLAKIQELPPPSCKVQTSKGKYHYYWFAKDGQSKELFKPCQQKLIAFLGGDKATCNGSRMMRLPGTLNMKDPDRAFLVEMLERAFHLRFSFNEVTSKITQSASSSEPREKLPKRPNLAQLVQHVSESKPGERNKRLCAASGASVYLLSNNIPREQIESALLQAALDIGLSEVEALATINSGLDFAENKLEDSGKSKSQRHIENLESIFQDRLRFNTMSKSIELDGEEDVDLDHLWCEIEKLYGLGCSDTIFEKVILTLAKQNSYNPVQEYLNSLPEVDEVKLLTDPASRYLGATQPIEQILVRKWLIGAVARAMKPGTKMDNVLFLKGEQGLGKTSFFSILGGDFFTTYDSDSSEKDELMIVHRHWIIEWGEMETQFTKKGISKIKSFTTKTEDCFRPPYGRKTETFPRSFVIAGSTNEDEVLSDPTGDRRFWMVDCSKVEMNLLKEERDQLWAEALHLYNKGEQHWLTKEEDSLRDKNNENFRSTDAWDEIIRTYLAGKSQTTVKDILIDALNFTPDKIDKRSEMRVSGYLKRIKWSKQRMKVGDSRAMFWISSDFNAPKEASQTKAQSTKPSPDIDTNLFYEVDEQETRGMDAASDEDFQSNTVKQILESIDSVKELNEIENFWRNSVKPLGIEVITEVLDLLNEKNSKLANHLGKLDTEVKGKQPQEKEKRNLNLFE